MNLNPIRQFDDHFRVNRDFTHRGKWANAFGGNFRVSLTRECRLKLFTADIRLINSVSFSHSEVIPDASVLRDLTNDQNLSKEKI